MIIWIDGTWGVGKTNVAMELKNKLERKKFELLNSDEYYIKMIKKNPYLALGTGTHPQNNMNFLKIFRELIIERLNKGKHNLIIDMALVEQECKEQLFDYLNDKSNNVHFILTAAKENIQMRINGDIEKERDKQEHINCIEKNIYFLKENFKNAIWINTDSKSIDKVVSEIIQYL